MSGEPSHASGEPSHASGEPSHASGEPSHASGEPSHASGELPHASGELPHASGEPPHTSGERYQRPLCSFPDVWGGSPDLWDGSPDLWGGSRACWPGSRGARDSGVPRTDRIAPSDPSDRSAGPIRSVPRTDPVARRAAQPGRSGSLRAAGGATSPRRLSLGGAEEPGEAREQLSLADGCLQRRKDVARPGEIDPAALLDDEDAEDVPAPPARSHGAGERGEQLSGGGEGHGEGRR